MSDTFFPILSTDNIPMIGREALLGKIWQKLTKASPDNLSIVGPRHIGKTVLLNALVDRAKKEDSPYSLVIYWQLGYAPPQSDDEFIKQLCDQLHSAMGSDAVTYKDHREELQSDKSLPVLKEVMDLLQLDTRSVLMIWDGFDKPLSQGLLSGQLFGNLRDLFYGKAHRVVTATRATQTELARSKQVEDSPFWNMFDVTPVRVGPFDDTDVEHALTTASLTVNQGGRKELINWTGGHPVLLLSILNSLVAQEENREFDNNQVNEAAEKVADELSEYLEKLWKKCSTATKNAFHMIIESDSGVDKKRIGKEEARHLVSRGFALHDNGMIKPSCRMFEQHAHGSKPDTSTLERMFGTWDTYRNEIRSILELRIKQIRPVDAGLHRLVTRCLEDIPDYPDFCLNNLTSIEEVALDAVWQHELGSTGIVPAAVIAYWTQSPRDGDNIVKPMMEADDWRLPRDRYKQLAILQRLTGNKMHFDPQSKSVSKDTYVLLNAIHQFRNRSEHAEGQAIHEGVAVSALLMCIELLSCLERELT
ncbi:AAA-like domain-containing protein [Gimesia maris]|uniref:AAA-like domain-containing protein n=1 Tax=Gimesia maris TaxID=122 RepID=UPI00241E9AF2|nr:AAA-like domain-containing protein [Gimesia maris]